MSQETTQAGRLGDLQRLLKPLAANAADLPQLELLRTQFEGLVGRAAEFAAQQATFTAGRLEATRQLNLLLTECERLATILRQAIKQHFGIRSEKLAEFGLQPFRGRKAKPNPEAPAETTLPAPAPAPAAPADPIR
jgi:hypothetical protein